MQETTNLKLRKPEYNEYADIMDINHNMDVVDQILKGLDERLKNVLTKEQTDVFYAKIAHRHNVNDIDNLISTIQTTKVNNAIQADNADRLRNMNFIWSGQAGQPPWLWGGADGKNMYVYNPANFSVANANSVQGFQFRNNNGMLEVLINGVWMSVGGQIYNRYATTTGGDQVGVITIKPFGEPRAGIQNEYQEGQEVVLFDWHKPSKIINFSINTVEVPHYTIPNHQGINLANIKIYLDDILAYDITEMRGVKMRLFSAGGNSAEWHNRYIEVRKRFKVVGKVTKNNIGAVHPIISLDMLYFEG